MLDPTKTRSDFDHLDHAAWGFKKAEAAWKAYDQECKDLHTRDPLAYARAEVAGYEARVAEDRRDLRFAVQCFRSWIAVADGARFQQWREEIKYCKSILRLHLEHLQRARKNLEALERE